MARVRPIVVAISFSLASMLGCEGEGPALLEGDVTAVYEAALEAVLDSIGISEDDRLLFPDRYIMFEEMMSSEDGPREIFHELTRRYGNSRVCDWNACPAVDGETQVMISRVRAPTPSDAELAVLTYIYDRGGIFGDGHQIRLVHDGRSWVVEDFQHVVVPE